MHVIHDFDPFVPYLQILVAARFHTSPNLSTYVPRSPCFVFPVPVFCFPDLGIRDSGFGIRDSRIYFSCFQVSLNLSLSLINS